MKKSLLIAALAVFGITGMNAQTSFGATAGLANVSGKVDTPFGSVSQSSTGFFVGVLADIGISEAFHVQPAITYTSVEDLGQIYVPIMAKYYFGDSGFNAQAGPQVRYIMEEVADDFSKLGIDLAIGAGYDINENIFVEARYGFQMNDHYTGDGDASLKYNTLNVGVGYKF